MPPLWGASAAIALCVMVPGKALESFHVPPSWPGGLPAWVVETEHDVEPLATPWQYLVSVADLCCRRRC